MTTCPQCGHQSQEDFTFCPACGTKAPAQPVPSDSLIGRTLNGKYRIVSEIGSGSMGTVYLGEHVGLKKRVALKVLHADLHVGDEILHRFQREGIAAGKFTHPNAIQIFDFDRDDGPVFYLAMEYVEGTSLGELLAAQGPLSAVEAIDLVRQVLSALAEAHRYGIVHRDLKPDNIMVVETSGRRRVKVLDFGLSKLVDRPTEASMQTQIGRIMGTPMYMSPEQCAGEQVDARTDLYAVGLVLYEMISGKKPFSGTSVSEILSKHITEEAPSLIDSNPDLRIPGDLDGILRRALEKDRELRFQTASEMLEAIDEVRLEEIGRPGEHRPRRTASRHPAAPPGGAASRKPLLAALLVIVVLLGLAGTYLVGGGSGARGSLARARQRPAAERTVEETAYLGLLDQARIALAGRDTALALSKVEEARRMPVADAEAYLVRGLVYRTQEDVDTALADFREALARDPDYDQAAAEPGWIHLERGDREAALRCFEAACKIDERSPSGLAGRGAVLYAEGQRARAVDLLEQALALDGSLAVAHLTLGRARHDGGDLSGAVESFVEAKRQDPRSWQAHAWLGRAYVRLERPEDAEDQFVRAVGLAPDSEGITTELAALLVGQGRFVDAEPHLSRALRASRGDGGLYVLRAIADQGQGKPEEAVTALEKAIELGEDGPRIQLLLGQLHKLAGRPPQALKHLRRAVELDETLARAQLDLGLVLMDLERFDEAEGPLDRAVELDPESVLAHYARGFLQMTFLENPEKARPSLERYLELGGKDPQVGQWLQELGG